jgi:hypothetical protein
VQDVNNTPPHDSPSPEMDSKDLAMQRKDDYSSVAMSAH